MAIKVIRKIMILLTVLVLQPMAMAVELGHLVYIGSPRCPACIHFQRTIAPIYPKTAEGLMLPLTDGSHWPRFKDIQRVPTFVVVDRHGKEIDRWEGFGSQDLFWMNITTALQQLSGKR